MRGVFFFSVLLCCWLSGRGLAEEGHEREDAQCWESFAGYDSQRDGFDITPGSYRDLILDYPKLGYREPIEADRMPWASSRYQLDSVSRDCVRSLAWYFTGAWTLSKKGGASRTEINVKPDTSLEGPEGYEKSIDLGALENISSGESRIQNIYDLLHSKASVGVPDLSFFSNSAELDRSTPMVVIGSRANKICDEGLGDLQEDFAGLSADEALRRVYDLFEDERGSSPSSVNILLGLGLLAEAAMLIESDPQELEFQAGMIELIQTGETDERFFRFLDECSSGWEVFKIFDPLGSASSMESGAIVRSLKLIPDMLLISVANRAFQRLPEIGRSDLIEPLRDEIAGRRSLSNWVPQLFGEKLDALGTNLAEANAVSYVSRLVDEREMEDGSAFIRPLLVSLQGSADYSTAEEAFFDALMLENDFDAAFQLLNGMAYSERALRMGSEFSEGVMKASDTAAVLDYLLRDISNIDASRNISDTDKVKLRSRIKEAGLDQETLALVPQKSRRIEPSGDLFGPSNKVALPGIQAQISNDEVTAISSRQSLSRYLDRALRPDGSDGAGEVAERTLRAGRFLQELTE